MRNNILHSVKGQNAAGDLLYKIYSSQKIPHAFLFSGPDGVGKHFMAVKFLELLNSPSEGNTSSSVALKVRNLSEPFVKFVMALPRGKNETGDNSPTEKLSSETLEELKEELEKKVRNPYYKINLQGANNIKISSIREIKKFQSLTYEEAKYRAVIISDAHLMNDEAQNALLKSLEEPPEGMIFFLITPFKNELLPTILSRCWTVNFDPLKREDLSEILTDSFGVEKQVADKISVFSNGSLTHANTLLDQDFDFLIEKTINILRNALALKYQSALKDISSFTASSSAGELTLLIEMIITWLNDASKNKLGLQEYLFSSHSGTLEKFNLKFSRAAIDEVVFKLNDLAHSIDNNLNLNVIALNIIFELASIRYFGIKSA
ncbi:MAG: ATP-binding protein [Syntrophomonadaceae bacterium]